MTPEPVTISVTDLRAALRRVLENAHFRGRHYLVQRAGEPMVAIVGIEEYERLRRAAEAEAGELAPHL